MAERAPDPTTQADDEPDEQVPAPERGPLTDDPEVPEADALEQSEEVVPRPAVGRLPDLLSEVGSDVQGEAAHHGPVGGRIDRLL